MGRLAWLDPAGAPWWRIATRRRFFWFGATPRTVARVPHTLRANTMRATPTSAIAATAYVVCIASPLLAQVGADAPDQSGGVTIEYIAHASFRITSPGGQRVLIDPFASRVWLGYDFPVGIEADAVVVTHPHYDHDAGEYRGRPWPWPDGVRVFRYPGEFEVGDAVVTGIPGHHVDPYGREFGQVNTIFVVETGGLRIAHVGDNGPLPDDGIEAMGRVDVLMLPIDGEYHILSQRAIEDAIRALRPRVVVPMHYRIPELEPGDGPDTLGPIDPWLEGRSNVTRVDGNVVRLDMNSLPAAPSIFVFRPHPSIPRADP